MKELKQNSLDQATTEIGFVKTLNENAEELGTEKIYLSREVELDDGTKVIVESVTPNKMKNILNNHIGEDTITFQTPGEIVPTAEEEIKGVVQVYNKALSDDLAISSLSNPEDTENANDEEDEDIDNLDIDIDNLDKSEVDSEDTENKADKSLEDNIDDILNIDIDNLDKQS